MISPARPEAPPESKPPTPSALPPFTRMVRVAGIAASPFVALCLIGGKWWLAISIGAGAVLSLAACGMLYLFVEQGMAVMVAGLRGREDTSAQTVQSVVSLIAKFLVVGGVGYAVMTAHAINLMAVLLGFVVAQAAVVLTAIRHWTPRQTGKI